AVYIVYERKILKQNKWFKKAVTPLIFYFLPITVIDIPIAATAIALFIGMDYKIIGIISLINNISLKIRTTVMVSCTIFVLPPFRKALFNLLGIKRHQNIA
ncbi:hypothetical protein LOAG_15538, partial [Loa loa]